MAVLFSGEITGLEPEFSADGAHTLMVRGYDKSHRLHLNKISRTFAEQTDSDIAKTIASEAGLTPEVDATTIKYEYVLQNNQTSIEFWTRAHVELGTKSLFWKASSISKKVTSAWAATHRS